MAKEGDKNKSCYFLVRSLNIGGAERQLLHLAKGLQAKGTKIKVITFYSGELDEEAKKNGLTVVNLEKSGRWDIIRFLFKLLNLIKKENPSVVYSFLEGPNILSSLLKLIWPKVKIAWGIRSSNMDLSLYSYVHVLTHKAMNFLSKYPDIIIFNSEVGRLFYREKFFNNNQKVISNGVDFEIFKFNEKLKNNLKQNLNISDDKFIIASVGRIDPIKDHETFLRACGILSRSIPQAVFIVLGKGSAELNSRLRLISKELKIEEKVIWLDMYKDMNEFYNGIDLHCLTSVSEGCPNVVLESMACGVSNVTTDVGDAKKIINEYGVTKPIKDYNGVAEAVLEIYNHKEGPSRKEISSYIESTFSLEKLVTNTEKVLMTKY